jgi:sugar lactone lactonase YvrE
MLKAAMNLRNTTQTSSRQMEASQSLRTAPSRLCNALAIFALLAAALLPARLLEAQVPAVVATSAVNVTHSGTLGAGQSVTDACGNVYVFQDGTPAGLVQISASTGQVTVISPNNNGYNGAPGLAIDSTKSHLYFQPTSQWYSANFSTIPITNCTPGTPATYGNVFGYPIGIYYYGTVQTIAVDGAGDVFFTGNCCSTGQILEETAAGTGFVAQNSWPNSITALAADSAGNVYFNDGSANIYQLKPPYTSAATVFATGFQTIVGLSFDAKGNLYIADSKSGLLSEIPLETAGLNPAHQYEVVAIPLTNNVSADVDGNLFTANYSKDLMEEKVGSAVLAKTAVGSTSANQTITYTFNSAETPTAISVDSGTAASATFASSGGSCAVGTAQTAGSSCTVTVTYAPTAAGLQTGVVTLAASGTSNTTTLSGVGLGAAATIDPGALTQLGLGFKTPQAIAVDSVGNVFVADAGASTITEFPVGLNLGAVLSTGSVTLSAPNGIAVDAAGDVFIADTGNNRIVEIPVIAGALSGTSTATFTAGLTAPSGLAFDASGNLYIADTGNKRGVVIANRNGTLDFTTPLAFGTGLSAPSAVTVDASGIVYLADAGTGQVIKFAQPAGGAPQITVVSGLSAPSGLATDASGSLYVVDKGNSVVDRYANSGGNLGTKTIVSSGIASPYGVASDASGNLYITDNVNALVEQEARVQTSLQFGGWNVGTTSTPLTATVSSAGNQALTLGTPSYAVSGSRTAGFAVTSNTCTAGSSLAVGGSCDLTATFTPPVPELNAEQDLTFASNAVNGTATLALVGTGADLTPSTLTLALTSPANSVGLTTGEAVSFTATVGVGSNTAVPGGNVKFYVNGTLSGTVKVANDVAVLSLPNGLPKGSVTINAVYSGDVINYTGSTATIAETVTPLSTTLTLAITTSYSNPTSETDAIAATGIPLTATVGIPGQIIPGGTVSFYAGSTLLGMASVSAAGGGVYDATLKTTALRAGNSNQGEDGSFITNYSITAVYSGDPTYTGSTSAAEPITVVGPPATQAACATAPTMAITSTSLTGGIATYTYTATANAFTKLSVPAAGEIVTITGTTNGGGILNIVGAVIASVNTTNNTFTVAGLSSTATLASAKDTGNAGPTCSPNSTGATYSLTPTSLSITVQPTTSGEGSGSAVLTVNSYGGWSGILNFSCAGLPQYATCSPYPGTPLINASTPGAVYTPTQVQFFIKTNVPPLVPTGSSFPWWIGGLTGLLLLAMRRRMGRTGSLRLLSMVAAFLLLGGSLMGISGCGSGTSSVPAYATPKGTSTVTVTVSGAQLVPGTTTEQTVLPDSTTTTFQITLVIQ